MSNFNNDNKKIPLIALVGLPNSGKSTLLNRLGHSRYKAVVANEAHTTRDLNYAEDYWDGMYMHFVDTGGLVPSPEDKIQKLVQLKSWEAIAKADLLIWVFDKTTRPENIAQKIIQGFWKSKKPFIIGINKIDNPNHEKSDIDYAQFGGRDFVNFSAANGYNLNVLMDKIIEQLLSLGFEKGNFDDQNHLEEENEKKTNKQQHHKIVRKKADGSYYVVRETNEIGEQTNFRALSAKEIAQFEENSVSAEAEIKNLIWIFANDFDIKNLTSVLDERIETQKQEIVAKDLETDLEENQINDQDLEQSEVDQTEELEELEKTTKTSVYNYNNIVLNSKELEGIVWQEYLEHNNFKPKETVVISSEKDYLDAVRKLGYWGVYFDLATNIKRELYNINNGKVSREKRVPKVLFMGKPNVGKSSLFNALAGTDIQIVSEVAGTTLSVNDTIIIRDKSFKK